MKLLKFGSLIAVGLLTACGAANEHSIFRTAEFKENKAVFVDAKQRAILSNQITEPSSDGSKTQTITRYCAEPSPDAFTVLSSSLGLSANLSVPQKADVSAKLSRSIAETGTNIGLRTQTITILRDMMYRLCERYMNGAISAQEFAIQAGRDQRIIVSILAIEQLTGAIQPNMVVVSTKTDSKVKGAAVGAGENEDEDEGEESVETQAEGDGQVVVKTVSSNEDVATVANVIKDIVKMTFETDEITLACINHVRNDSLSKFCEKHLANKTVETTIKTNSSIKSLPKDDPLRSELEQRYLPPVSE